MNTTRSFPRLTLCGAALAVAATSAAMAQNRPRPLILARGAPLPDSSAAASLPAAAAKPGATPAEKTSKNATLPATAPTTIAHSTLPVLHAVPASVSGTSALDGDFNVPLPDEKVLHVMVGHSVFVDTKHRLSRVYITNPDVLNSYTSSPNQVVLTAKQAGTSNFIVWDEAGDTQVYMVSAETNVDGLENAIKKAFPAETIDVAGAEGRITLTGTVGTQATADAVGKLAGLYGKDITNALYVSSSKIKQVRLRVRFAELDRSRLAQYGVNLFGILNSSGNATLVQSSTGAFPSGPQINTGSSGTGSTTVNGRSITVNNPLNFFLYDFQHQIGATIQDLEDKQVMHILAEPSITALSGEKANFLAGGEFPFPVVQGGTAGSAAAVSIVFKPFGVKLDFTPVVNADGTIDLTVAPEVSALDYANAVTVSGYTIPALSTRRAQTHVAVRDGQSFAISGLLDQRTTDALGRTPGIASVPILGALFRSKNVNHSISELVVIVTPELIDPLTDNKPLPPDPVSPIPFLNQQKFDTSVSKSKRNPGVK